MKPIKFKDIIQSKNIYLKSLELHDASKLFDLINSQRKYIGEYLDWVENIKTIDDEIDYVKTQINASKNLQSFDWCIYKNETNEFLGYIGTDPVTFELFKKGEYIDWENKIISFAYFLKQEANGFGYMTEALELLKEISINLGFKQVEIHSEPENIKSQKVAERCGFVHDKQEPGKMNYEKDK